MVFNSLNRKYKNLHPAAIALISPFPLLFYILSRINFKHYLLISITILSLPSQKIELLKMANHKSSIKRIRQTETRNERNRYQHKTLRSAMKKFMALSDKSEAKKQLPTISSMLDRLAKRSIIHKNKASNLKSELAMHLNHIK